MSQKTLLKAKFTPLKPDFNNPMDSSAKKRAENLKRNGFGKEIVELIKKDKNEGWRL